jgi:hypothetical protein
LAALSKDGGDEQDVRALLGWAGLLVASGLKSCLCYERVRA